MRPFCLAILLVVSAILPTVVVAHEMSMAEMQIRELSQGNFLWQWGAGEKRAPSEDLTPVWPSACRAESSMLLCGAAGMNGELSIKGVGQGYSAALVKIFWLDGQARVYTLTAAQPKVHLFGSAEDRRGLGEIASAYILLGIEHILAGIDHQLFVIGLIFLVGFNRRLIWTISAFTAAHSVTLACSALGLLVLHSPPVEATIALSIVLVAGEALHEKPTLARRFPALVAFLFGLVHGLGFAGALQEIGLPENYLSIALLTFNVGVELGQLAIVMAALLLWRLTIYWPWLVKARASVLYGIGSVAAYWSWERALAIFG